MAHTWREAPMPPLEGEVPNEREAEGFVRKLSKKEIIFFGGALNQLLARLTAFLKNNP